MKPLIPLVLSLAFLTGAHAQSFPVPVTPARAVSGEPQVVTSSLTRQTNVSIAAASNGYAVVWSEEGQDAFFHAYVRRFSAAGTPLDDAPIRLVSWPFGLISAPPPATIASNGATYLLGWWATPAAGYVFRRLAAESGTWIDAQPVPLGIRYGILSLASNGTDALALVLGNCGDGYTNCLRGRRIAMTGEPLTSPMVSIRPPTTEYDIKEARIESNGSEYLAAWIEMKMCLFPCNGMPENVYATRLRSDATVIDSAPLELDFLWRGYAFGLTIASSDSKYLVGWSHSDGVRGTRITAEGAILDRTDEHRGGGVLLVAAPGHAFGGIHSLQLYAGVLQKRFVLLIRHDIDAGSPSHVMTNYVEGLTLTPDTDLKSVMALPRTVVFGTEVRLKQSLSMAAKGSTLAIAYDAGPPATGGVPRAFLRLFGDPARRRPAAHHEALP